MKIFKENTKTFIAENTDEEIKNVIEEINAALRLSDDTSLRCIYLLKAEKILQKVIYDIVCSFI